MNFPFILSKSDFTLYSHINTFCLFEERILLHTLNLRSPCFSLPSSGTSAVFYHTQPSFSICVCLLFHLESLSHICPNFSNQMLSILYMLHKRFIWSFHSWRIYMLIYWFKSLFLTLEIERSRVNKMLDLKGFMLEWVQEKQFQKNQIHFWACALWKIQYFLVIIIEVELTSLVFLK